MVQRNHHSSIFQSDLGLGKGKELEASENEIPKSKAREGKNSFTSAQKDRADGQSGT
jgi:hypothetical protein